MKLHTATITFDESNTSAVASSNVGVGESNVFDPWSRTIEKDQSDWLSKLAFKTDIDDEFSRFAHEE